jgi:hypothetical protein
MKNIDELLKNISTENSLIEDFETKVYSKIKIKKLQRKITHTVSFIFLCIAIFMGYFFFIQDKEEPEILNAKSDKLIEKEEIPIIEDIYFASYDDRANYAIEQISIDEEEDKDEEI